MLEGGIAKDAATLQPLEPAPTEYEAVVVNNRVRGQLEAAFSAFQLFSDSRDERLAAAKALESSAQASVAPILEKVLDKETDPAIKTVLAQIKAGIDLKSSDPQLRMAAVKVLGESSVQRTKQLLYALLEQDAGGAYTEPDEKVREAALAAIKAIDQRLAVSDYAGRLFSGISLGSILLLAALGLAITYGLLGVINMAHGEMIMIGAYATFVTQQVIRSHVPGLIEWYPVFAVPVAFLASRAGGHGAGAQRDPLAVWAAAGDAAGDLGHQPVPDPARAADLRRPERGGGQSVVDVRRHRVHQPDAAVQPNRHHRVRLRRAGRDVAGALAHAARVCSFAESLRTGPWPHAWASLPAVWTCSPSVWARESPGWLESPCPRSATSARTWGRATSSTLSWWWCWAG